MMLNNTNKSLSCCKTVYPKTDNKDSKATCMITRNTTATNSTYNREIPTSVHKTQGYVLLLTFLIIGAATLLIAQLANHSSTAYTLATLNSKKKQARYLALSGIQSAIGMLASQSSAKESEKEESKKPQAAGQQPAQKNNTNSESQQNSPQKPKDVTPLNNALFQTNIWHTITLDDKKDGIDGSITFYLSAESGKIPLNMLIDQEKWELSAAGKKITTLLDEKLKQLLPNQSLKNMIEKSIKTRKKPFDDVSQIIDEKNGTAKALEKKLYITPENTFALTDLFSLEESTTINPLFLSESAMTALGLSKEKQKKEQSAEAIKALKKEILDLLHRQNIDWKTIWDKGVAPRVGKQYTDISQSVAELFSKRLEDTTFSLTVRGTYQDVQQSAYAIIGSVVEKGEKDTSKRFFYIKRIYWL